MKWVFLLLVLANAGFVAWQGFSAVDAGAQQAPVYAPPVSERIYLIGEARPEGDLLAQSLPEATLEPEPESEPVEEVLSELNQAVANAVQQNAAEQDRRENLLCPVLELERDADRRTVSDALRNNNLAFSQNEITGKRDKYWLYIAAPATTAQAQDIVAELKLKRIDSYVIARGEMKNRISLGLFSSQERAQQAQTMIAQRSGKRVSIYEHERTVKLYELLLDQPISENAWAQFLQQLDLSKLLIKIEKNPC
ncbi:Sporulation related domain protein [Marinomonas aquimarina]|uniref:Sporulation related domain protein n=1 Tax=Marinomonas aquimarina TaxID=295068 RepID=A0A1A8TB44_9GAMM|nr:SPOR domain-containing protein [Marinomonas aquimarina]SBS29327.1 Sporulation related domain protein [Marinomonas aquimarina]